MKLTKAARRRYYLNAKAAIAVKISKGICRTCSSKASKGSKRCKRCQLKQNEYNIIRSKQRRRLYSKAQKKAILKATYWQRKLEKLYNLNKTFLEQGKPI